MTQESVSRRLDKVIVRLPDGMRDQLKSAAEANNRSMNAEIVSRLEGSFLVDTSSPNLNTDEAKKIIESVFKYLSEEGWTPPDR